MEDNRNNSNARGVNHMDDNRHGSIFTTLIVGVVALAIGLAIGYAVWNKDKDANNQQSQSAVSATTKAADLRANLVGMAVEHQQLTAMAVGDALDGSPGAEASKAALIKNGQDISAAVGSVYGEEAGNKFNEIWNIHLTEFVNYAVAGKSGDNAAKQQALATIDSDYTKPISALLAGANPNLQQAQVEALFKEHIDMTAQIVDHHVNGDYTAEQELLQRANHHIGELMSALADAIVKQYPDRFQA